MESQASAQTITVEIHAAQQTIPLGRTAHVDVNVQTPQGVSPQDYVLLPFVNGGHQVAPEQADADRNATLHLPLPNVGPVYPGAGPEVGHGLMDGAGGTVRGCRGNPSTNRMR
jgi:hypothetical protein